MADFKVVISMPVNVSSEVADVDDPAVLNRLDGVFVDDGTAEYVIGHCDFDDGEIGLSGGSFRLKLKDGELRLVTEYEVDRALTEAELDELLSATRYFWGNNGSEMIELAEGYDPDLIVTPLVAGAVVDAGAPSMAGLRRGPSEAAGPLIVALADAPKDAERRGRLVAQLRSEGEPWAEVVELDEERRAADPIIAVHAKRWLGALAHAARVTRSYFSGGLLSTLTCSAADDAAYDGFKNHPHLASIIVLKLACGSPAVAARVLSDPLLRYLAGTTLTLDEVHELRNAKVAWRLLELKVVGRPDRELADELDMQPAFDRLERLDVASAKVTVEDMVELARSPVGRRLHALRVDSSGWLEADVNRWLSKGPELGGTLERIGGASRNCRYELEKSKSGAWNRLSIVTGYGDGIGVGDAVKFLGMMRPGSLESVSVRHSGAGPFLLDFRRTIEGAIKKLDVPHVVLPELA